MVINTKSPQGSKPPQGGRRRKAFRALLVIFILLLISLIGVITYVLIDVSKIWSDPGEGGEIIAEETDEEAQDLPEATFQEGDVTAIEKADNEIDILMIGVDNRSDKFSGRSDVMMYMRVNTTDKTIKLVSFMRDTLVKIDGHGKNKLNTAYGFGSVDLMYETYHDSFGLEPDYYIVVNFYGMEDIIDAMGGVDIEIERDELEWLNININEINKETSGENAANITKSGTHHLNGRQAVAYMRIRHPGFDQGRIARQQTVMFKLFEKAQSIGMGQIPDLIGTLSQYVRTDMPLSTMVDLASAIRGMQKSGISTFRYPDEFESGSYNSMSVVQPKDFNTEFQKLYNFLNS
jgi:LCP family protein required for cell wall assembly